MTRPIIRIHDLATDEIIDREMNDAEFAKYEIELAQIEADKIAEQARQAEAQAKAQAKAAVLAQLGITEEQAKLLLS